MRLRTVICLYNLYNLYNDFAAREDEAQLGRWRLRGDLLRVATYYRVTGAKRRAERRTRRERAKTRFRQRAMTVLRGQRQQGADGDGRQGDWEAAD